MIETFRFVEKEWHSEFTEALRVDASELRIICPFIKAGAIDSLLSWQPGAVQTITRFNLADFAEGVSDIAALQKLLNVGASVRGVRNLHAKLYLFGTSRAIITSANLTESALKRNHEFGMVSDDAAVIEVCRAYFDRLWQRAGCDLQHGQVNAWNETVTARRVHGGRPDGQTDLDDFGADAGLLGPPPVQLPVAVADAPQAFVKLNGTVADRSFLSASTFEAIERSGCHRVACYPTSKRPRNVKDGAVIYMGRFTRNPNDIRVFGWAIGMQHEPVRDDATPAEIERRPWKEQWSRYIRVDRAEFVAGTMQNGVSLNELMDTLKENSFASTQRNAAQGRGNTDPRHAYRQQAAVELSGEGHAWLSKRLQDKFEAHGKIPQDSLRSLD